jgi:hypothetical protein
MPRLTVLMGAPGAGKSTYAKSTGAHVVTTDAGRAGRQAPGEILHNAYREINAALAAGKWLPAYRRSPAGDIRWRPRTCAASTMRCASRRRD